MHCPPFAVVLLAIVTALWFAAPLAHGRPEPQAVLVENRFVNPNSGVVLGTVPGASAHLWAAPVPGQPGRFRIGDLVVDAIARTVVAREPEELALDGEALVRKDAAGQVRWTARLPGRLGGVRPPDRLLHGGRAFVVCGTGVAALDAETGRELWRAEGENDRLFASGDLLLATSCAGPVDPKAGRWLIARAVDTGAEVFRGRLPDDCDPDSIGEVAGLIVVRADGFGGKGGFARFFRPDGELAFALEESVSRVWSDGTDLVVVSGARIARLDLAGKVRWESRALTAADLDAAAVLPLEGGDLIVMAWSPIADSGVEVARLAGTDGRTVWKTKCAEVGVSHSKYWHRPYAEVRVDRLVVVSQGAYGNFIEILSLESGASVFRVLVGE